MNVVGQPRAAVRLNHDESFPAHFHFRESHPDHRFILKTRVDATSYDNAEATVAGFIAARRPSYVCVASVHSVMEARDDPEFNEILNAALLVTPDGMPLVWGLRALGLSTASRVYGPEFNRETLRLGRGRGCSSWVPWLDRTGSRAADREPLDTLSHPAGHLPLQPAVSEPDVQ